MTRQELESKYDELVSAARELVKVRESSDVKIVKPYDELRDELHVVNMDKTSQERFDWWKIEYNAMIHKRVWDDTPFNVERHMDYWRVVLFKDEKLYSDDLFKSYMNRVLCSLGMTFDFGTVDSLLSFDEFRKACELTDDELYDTLTIAKAKIEQMLHSDLVALIDFSNKLNTLVETRAKESCCDYVFGERSY
jgi:hypothetical protein